MIISGFQKLSLLDYPTKMAAIIFTSGCNFKCSFCHNSPLINKSAEGLYQEEDILNYLDKRKNILDGLVISGGEPTMQKDLIEFIKKVKAKGLNVKLDTNGSNYKVLKKLIDNDLVDYVAMDIKDIYEDYPNIIKIKTNVENIQNSINLLKEEKVDYEFRTTIINGYHDLDKIYKMIDYVGENSKYYLQNFKDNENVLDKSLKSFSQDELKFIAENLKKFPNVKVRGL